MLCTDKVRLVGDPVVMVVAESRYQAEDACELVEVDTRIAAGSFGRAPRMDPVQPAHLRGSRAPTCWPRYRPSLYGDVDGAFARADRIITAHMRQHRHQNVPMEGRGTVADFDPDDRATDGPRRHPGRPHGALHHGRPARPATRQVTGAGRRDRRFVRARSSAPAGRRSPWRPLSKALGRPVKWIEDRNENLTISGQAREESFDVEAAVTNDGDILGLQVSTCCSTPAPIRAWAAWSGNIMQAVMPGPYKLQGLSFASTVAITNKASYVAYRGPWAAETFVRERMINLSPAELGIDPLEVRLRNVATRGEPPDEMVTGRSLAGVTALEAMERIASVVDFADFRRRQAAARAEGRLLGIGVASYIEAAPGPRGGGGPLGAEKIRARLDADGTVVVYTGQMPHGQGHQTTLAQIAADQMGVPFESGARRRRRHRPGAAGLHRRQPGGHHGRRRIAARRSRAAGQGARRWPPSCSRPARRIWRSLSAGCRSAGFPPAPSPSPTWPRRRQCRSSARRR